MFKKLGSIVLSVIICLSLLSGCQTNMKFVSESEMKSHVKGVWQDGSTYYVINDDKVSKFYDWMLARKLLEIENDESVNIESLTFENFYQDNPLIIPFANIEYKYNSGKIVSSHDNEEIFSVIENGNLKQDDSVLTKISSECNYLEDFIKEEFNAELNNIKFNKKYAKLPSAKEVQYNKWSYLAQKFIVTGTAQLDDYYNWGYDGLEALYFCIRIRPTGGTFSDEWYIYADRNKFSDLYQSLLNGSKTVSLVSEMWFYDTGSNNMATLVDYK